MWSCSINLYINISIGGLENSEIDVIYTLFPHMKSLFIFLELFIYFRLSRVFIAAWAFL